MCGIVGIITSPGRADAPAILDALSQSLIHRGPDAHGRWSDEAAGLHFDHRRLAIIDLSPAGLQPMVSADDRFVILFNGEIFNFPALRDELLQRRPTLKLRGHSDTEILLEWVSAAGIEAALSRIEGQFALAVWDRAERVLHLARDRFGEKPLYYGLAGADFVFASELRTLARHPAFERRIDADALNGYLRLAYTPGSSTIYAGARKLPPACRLEVRDGKPGAPIPYWRAERAVQTALSAPFQGDEAAMEEAVDQTLRRSVAARMLSDAPLGALLSGGIDSSTVVAMMQAQSPRPIRTFTLSAGEAAIDEAPFAEAVAAHLGTDHTTLRIEESDLLQAAIRMGEVYDEPFADSSQIPTFLISRTARTAVTVALSGDGGDEMFGGYNRHIYGGSLARRLQSSPRLLRAPAAGALTLLSPGAWSSLVGALGPLAPRELRHGKIGDKVHKFANVMSARSVEDFYGKLISVNDKAAALLVPSLRREALPPGHAAPVLGSFSETAMYLDLVGYLPDDILVKVDRASMACSLEGRTPFLDTGVLSLAWSLPLEAKIGGGVGKRILRTVLERYMPSSMFDRPKQGFAIPIDAFLRGPLKSWAGDLLSSERLKREGVFDPAAVEALWHAHQSGRRNLARQLWTLVMFQAWSDATKAA